MLVVHEAGKPLAEADGDVAEAIDFLRYYARAPHACSRRPSGLTRSRASATP